jgi:hypothetical protein
MNTAVKITSLRPAYSLSFNALELNDVLSAMIEMPDLVVEIVLREPQMLSTGLAATDDGAKMEFNILCNTGTQLPNFLKLRQ